MTSNEIIFVDDDERTRDDIAQRISELVGCKTVPVDAPRLDETDDLLERNPSLVIIDYLLANKREDGSVAGYHGGTLLNKLLEGTQEIPIVIITRDDVYPTYPNLRQLAEIADLVFLKSSLDKAESRIGRKLCALIKGYKEINEECPERSWASLMKLLDASASEENLLDETNPPIGPDDSIRLDETDLALDDIQVKKDVFGWTTHDASKWIIGVLFSYPGILYDYRNAAVSLGIDPESFIEDEKLQSYFQRAKYCGAFKEYDEYWWRGRLRNIAISFMNSRSSQPIQEIFPKDFAHRENISIKQAKCNSSGEIADTICYILKEPVKTDYSLPYYPDNRPSIMDPARISFKVIRISNRAKINLIKKTDRALFNDIKRGELDDILKEVI